MNETIEFNYKNKDIKSIEANFTITPDNWYDYNSYEENNWLNTDNKTELIKTLYQSIIDKQITDLHISFDEYCEDEIFTMEQNEEYITIYFQNFQKDIYYHIYTSNEEYDEEKFNEQMEKATENNFDKSFYSSLNFEGQTPAPYALVTDDFVKVANAIKHFLETKELDPSFKWVINS